MENRWTLSMFWWFWIFSMFFLVFDVLFGFRCSDFCSSDLSPQPHPLILMIVKKIQNSQKNYLHFLDIVIWRDLNNRIFFNLISFWVWLWILQTAVFVIGSRLKICALQNFIFYSRDNFGSVTNKSVWRIVSINELIFFCQSSNKYLSSSPETITNQKSQLQIYDKCCVAWTTKKYAKKNPNSKIPKISPTETISYYDSLFVNSPSPIHRGYII